MDIEQAKQYNLEAGKQLIRMSQELYEIKRKLEKIKQTCKKCNLDKPNDVFDLKYKILEIIESEE